MKRLALLGAAIVVGIPATASQSALLPDYDVGEDVWHRPRFQWSHIGPEFKRFPPLLASARKKPATVAPPPANTLLISQSQLAKLQEAEAPTVAEDDDVAANNVVPAERRMRMKQRGADGQLLDFICFMPALDAASQGPPSAVAAETAASPSLPSVKEAAAALEGMKQSCLYATLGWWTYEYCHLGHLRQYHEEPARAAPEPGGPVEPALNFEFILGRFDARTVASAVIHRPTTGDGNFNQMSSSQSPGLTMNLRSGTVCDVTGQPRQIDVQFVCSRLFTGDRIASLKEVATCRYTALIQTTRLCELPGFKQKPQDLPKPVHCKQLVSDEEFERETVRRQQQAEEARKKHQQQQQERDNKQGAAQVVQPADLVQALLSGRRNPPPKPDPAMLAEIYKRLLGAKGLDGDEQQEQADEQQQGPLIFQFSTADLAAIEEHAAVSDKESQEVQDSLQAIREFVNQANANENNNEQPADDDEQKKE